ncbi:MAG: phage replisome organizer N-terminal domain-containing protein, partial [Leuconostoc suionicum]
MADNKKYYYIRLKDSFFDSDEIKLLESIPNDGYKFSNILLKMYLKS